MASDLCKNWVITVLAVKVNERSPAQPGQTKPDTASEWRLSKGDLPIISTEVGVSPGHLWLGMWSKPQHCRERNELLGCCVSDKTSTAHRSGLAKISDAPQLSRSSIHPRSCCPSHPLFPLFLPTQACLHPQRCLVGVVVPVPGSFPSSSPKYFLQRCFHFLVA